MASNDNQLQEQGPDSEQTASICLAAQVQIPMFYKNEPELWFHNLECQFALRHITVDMTKYLYAASKIDPTCTGNIKDIMENIPSDGTAYQTLKTRMLETYGLTDEERADRLLDQSPIGDRNPYDVVIEYKEMIRKDDVQFLLKHMFMRRLPEHIRGPLSAIAEEENDLVRLGKHAARIWRQTAAKSGNVNAIRSSSSSAGAPKRPTPRAATGRSFQARKPSPQLCWYHQKWGNKANKCEAPCTWNKRSVNEVEIDEEKNL